MKKEKKIADKKSRQKLRQKFNIFQASKHKAGQCTYRLNWPDGSFSENS